MGEKLNKDKQNEHVDSNENNVSEDINEVKAEKVDTENAEKQVESKQNDKDSNIDDIIKEKEEIIKKKDAEIASLKESMLRRQADFENFKKRSVKNAELNKKLVIKDISLDIMDIHDNLLRASEAASNIPQGDSLEKAHEAYVEGVMMISKNIESVLEKYGIEEIEAINIPFNPEYHEAVEFDMSDEVDSDTVTRVYQKGFKFDTFVIRTSKVKVTKPMVKIAEEDKSEKEADLETKEQEKATEHK